VVRQNSTPLGKEAENQRASTVPDEEKLPRLIADGNLQRCSVSGYPFPADIRLSMSLAFAEHLNSGHIPAQFRKDKNQTTAGSSERQHCYG